jgi:hypothetical protein
LAPISTIPTLNRFKICCPIDNSRIYKRIQGRASRPWLIKWLNLKCVSDNIPKNTLQLLTVSSAFLELAAEKNEEWSTTMLMTKSGLSYIEAFNMLEDSFGSISNVVNFLPPITIVALFYFILANLTERFSVWILKEKTLSKKAIELAHAMTGLVNAVVIGFASLSEVLANWNRPISEGTEAYFDSSAALLTLIVGYHLKILASSPLSL